MNAGDELVLRWRLEQAERSRLAVRRIAWSEMERWNIDRGHLRHDTGGFFSVVGLRYGEEESTDRRSQPYILQPEIGILGFLMCRDDRGVRILVQGKTEPGNVGGTQLAPSFSAPKVTMNFGMAVKLRRFQTIFCRRRVGLQ